MTAPVHGLTAVGARSIIDSLSSGVVPRDGAQLFTAGRERWLTSLSEDLDDLASDECGEGRLRVFIGRNGDGKTHLMQLLRRRALDAGFAVSYVVISAETPLYRADRVYAAIGSSVTANSKGRQPGLRSILDPESPDPSIAADFADRAATIRRISGIDPRFASVVYRYCTRQTVNVDQEQDLLLLGSWLEGVPGRLAGMGVTGQVDASNGASILRSAVLVLRHFGLRGLVILVDEVESVLNLRRPQRRDSYQSLRLLIDRENLPNHALLVASMTPPMFTDADLGIQTYPALWSRLQPEGRADFVNYNSTLVDLTRTPLSEDDFFAIGQRIREIHQYARAWDAADRVSNDFLRAAAATASQGRLTMVFSPTRVFVKLIAETLETAHQHPAFTASAEKLAERFGQVDESLQHIEGAES